MSDRCAIFSPTAGVTLATADSTMTAAARTPLTSKLLMHQTTNLGVRSSNLCAPGDWQGVVGGSPTR
jgi:hypothetical protein